MMSGAVDSAKSMLGKKILFFPPLLNFSGSAAQINLLTSCKQAGGRGLFLLLGAHRPGHKELPGDSEERLLDSWSFKVEEKIQILTFGKHLLRARSCEPVPPAPRASELPTVAKIQAGSMKPELLSTLTFKQTSLAAPFARLRPPCQHRQRALGERGRVLVITHQLFGSR